MPLDYDKLIDFKVEGLVHRYGPKDTMLYALGVGLGEDPLDERQLAFVYEKELKALPTMAAVLAYPHAWLEGAKAGIDRVRQLHGEQGIRIHKPIPPAGELIGSSAVTRIVDKGKDKGALVYSERKVHDRASGDLIFTATATSFCRADGGFGGPSGPAKPIPAIPDREPDAACELRTLPQQALIYRLSGDMNRLHADPATGRAAGFPGPILHGLCTFGVAGHALLRTLCDYDPARLAAMDVRFSAPVFPGETILTEMWREDGRVLFRSSVPAREVVVLNNGVAEVR
ncbi:MaoC/PaaZ C-terminal domain-containing protein [Pigmentiphaga soli]|uniref:MaoC/PaaZ C-terminal domain-containing protein n=1 Tax=Pigmentiphaga soli TaxID=1007095 RepID=A0ABP8H993_9BURK